MLLVVCCLLFAVGAGGFKAWNQWWLFTVLLVFLGCGWGTKRLLQPYEPGWVFGD